jgi:hypothetical protein
MPFLLIIAGTVFLVSGVRGTSTDLLTLLKGDFTGKNNFLYWMFAILVLGALGYSQTLRPLSRAFMALVVIVLFLANGGFFKKFNSEFFTSPVTPGNTGSGFGGFGGGQSDGAGAGGNF